MTSFSIPPPPTTTPPSIHPASYRSARETELDSIRRRGLAKIFNKHFSTVTDTISREREVAEAALEEIEKRKAELAANPRAFQGNLGNLTQLDQLYLELSRRKAEIQRKERETQELYKRYVDQYGMKETASLKPNITSKYSHSSNGSLMPMTHEATVSVGGSSLSSDVVHQADLLLLKIAQRRAALASSSVGSLTQKIEDSIQSKSTTLLTGNHTKNEKSSFGQIRCTTSTLDHSILNLPENSVAAPSILVKDESTSEKGDLSTFSLEHTTLVTHLTAGIREASHEATAMDLSMGSYSGITDSIPRTKLLPEIPEHEPVDRSIMHISYDTPQKLNEPRNEPSTPADTSVSKTFSLDRADSPSVSSDVDCNDDFDADSNMSALTDMDGITIAEAEWRLTEFLKTETENIRKMLITESSFENFLDKDTDSGTVVSTESKISMEATLAAEKMARSMAEASAWMNDPSMLKDDDDINGKEVENIDQENSGTICEWHAYWSQEHDREYYFNSNTKQTCWSRPQRVMIDMSTLTSPQEKRLVYGKDEIIAEVKDYSKKVVVSKKRNDAMSENIEMIDLYKPDSGRSMTENSSITSGGTSKRSKLSEYRYKMIRRQKRNQRLMFVALVGFLAFILFLYTQNLRREKMISDQRLAEAENLRIEIEAQKQRLGEEEIKLRREFERIELMDQNMQDDDLQDRTLSEIELLPVESRSYESLGEDVHIDKEIEHEIVGMEFGLFVNDDMTTRQELSPSASLGTNIPNVGVMVIDNNMINSSLSTNEMDGMGEDITTSMIKVEQGDHVNGLVTPPGCLFPFAYVFSLKCRILAEKKHWFDVKSLVDSMLQ